MTELPAPRLFDGPLGRPTSRMVAQWVREGGVAALPDSVRRGDGVRYQEIVCRSALNRVEGMPFHWTLNPYRGCAHGCHYCFARRYHAHLELGPGDEFSSVVLVKTNFPDVLRQELARPSWGRELVALGTATDPYQPIEGRYRLTRRTLAVLLEARTPVGVVTKGPLVVRDADLLADLSRVAGCTVYFSVPTVDDDIWAALEPGTAPPRQRLRAAKRLADAGIRAGVLLAPVVPGLTTGRRRLERTLGAIADHGVAFVGASLLHLEGGTRDHFLAFLSRAFPHLAARYERLYAGKYAPREYAAQVHALVAALERRYALLRLPRGAAEARATRDAPGAPEVQPALFRWGRDDPPRRGACR
jgi:DNA repair photolyase